MLLFLSFEGYAGFQIKGQLNLSEEWQSQVFLSTINKLDDYYSANPEDIIQVGYVQEDGSFSISGNNLPPEDRFYRLYTIKKDNSEFDACLYGEDHNFIHLILNNNTEVEVHTDPDHFAPFGNYSVIGNSPNVGLQRLSTLIYPSFYFHKIKFHSELQFSQEKLNRDLFEFADTCQQSLVALAAIINTDMDKYYPIEENRYSELGQQLQETMPGHNYTRDYFRKINYHKGDSAEAHLPIWVFLMFGAFACFFIWAVATINSLKKKIATIPKTAPSTPTPIKPQFTPQEEKILQLILEEKSNKEIAATLFIELSTVKTHINKLYSKLGAKNRAEAKLIARKTNLQTQ